MRTQGQKQTEELSGAGMGSCLQRTDARHAAACSERGAQRVMEQDAWSVLEKGLLKKEESAGEEEDANEQMGECVLSAWMGSFPSTQQTVPHRRSVQSLLMESASGAVMGLLQKKESVLEREKESVVLRSLVLVFGVRMGCLQMHLVCVRSALTRVWAVLRVHQHASRATTHRS